ncbi:MAG: hypothetical protein JHD35_06430 [Sphingopyxis sp.]|nr:hypothetical protein [Sphingopyxis sp.]
MRVLATLISLIFPIFLGGCVTFLPTIHYRLTIVIDTPQGRRSGSGVTELKSIIGPKFPIPKIGGLQVTIHGEAVPVRLADGNYIFVVRKWQRGQEETLRMLRSSFAQSLTPISISANDDRYDSVVKDQFEELSRIRGSRPVSPEYYPIVAHFTDINDPNSIVAADAGRVDQIVKGAKLVSMTIEITDDPVTRRINAILPWFEKYRNDYFDPYARANPAKELPSEKRIEKSHFYSQ